MDLDPTFPAHPGARTDSRSLGARGGAGNCDGWEMGDRRRQAVVSLLAGGEDC